MEAVNNAPTHSEQLRSHNLKVSMAALNQQQLVAFLPIGAPSEVICDPIMRVSHLEGDSRARKRLRNGSIKGSEEHKATDDDIDEVGVDVEAGLTSLRRSVRRRTAKTRR